MKKGRCILVDGTDGCGKTSLISRLKEEHPEYIYLREPGDSHVKGNETLRHKLLTEDLSCLEQAELLFKDRNALLKYYLENNLSEKFVIIDRCFISSLVYQAAPEENLNIGDLLTLHKYYLAKLTPLIDQIIILNISDEERLKRIQTRSSLDIIESKNEVFFKEINKRYRFVKQNLIKHGYIELANKIFYLNANDTFENVYIAFKEKLFS